MSTLVKARIDEEVALLERTVDTPTAPFGYGTDISCDSDVDELARDVDGFTTLALAQAAVRRLDCPRGALPDDANYGIDLRSYLNRPTTSQELLALGGQVRNELKKDDRIDTVTVRTETFNAGTEMRLKIAIRPFDPRLGGFSLTLAVTSAGIVVEEIAANG